MRDASRIRERRDSTPSKNPMVWSALGAVMVLVLTFSLGMMVGKQTAQSASAPAGALTLADIEEARNMREDLKFYRSLTEATKAPVADPAPVKDQVASQVPAEQAVEAQAHAPAPAPVVKPAQATKQRPGLESNTTQEAQPSVRSALTRLAESASETNQPSALGGYTVHVSSFPSLEEAEAYQSSLVRKGYSPYMVSANLPGRGTWFRVRLGHYTEKGKALDAKDALAQANIPGWVLSIE